tara:strand:- start:259 stop:441 length:183 start_codon:yes stop_codon:yes gene_type:complete
MIIKYQEFVGVINNSSTYHGDAVVEGLVEMSNELSLSLEDVINLQQEITGETYAQKEDEA